MVQVSGEEERKTRETGRGEGERKGKETLRAPWVHPVLQFINSVMKNSYFSEVTG